MSGAARRLVIDTNVVLDLLLFADPRVAPVAAALADGTAECFADAETMAELERVLGYPELRQDPVGAAVILGRFRALARVIDPPADLPALPRCKDPDDQKFLRLAVAVGADVLLTRDRALLALGRKIRAVAPELSILPPDAWSKHVSGPV